MDYSKKTKKYWRNTIKSRGVQALGGKCAICGCIYDDCCYDFHHLNPEEKDFTISNGNINGARDWLRIRDELKKCALLCANCHRRYHNNLVDLEIKNYFNEEYYEWDLCDARAVNTTTGEPIEIKNICPICGKNKSSKSRLCVDCSGIYKPHFEVSREELKELIYKYPFTKIGEMFNVTDNSIRKRCKKYNLPSKKTEIVKYTPEEWEKV